MSVSAEVRALLKEWGGRGGRARARSLSPRDRTRIARKAARARWRPEGAGQGGFPGQTDLGEIAPKIIGGSMTAWAGRESFRWLDGPSA